MNKIKAYLNKVSNFINDHWRVPFFIYVAFLVVGFFLEVVRYDNLLDLDFRYNGYTSPYTGEVSNRFLDYINIKIHRDLYLPLLSLMPVVLFLIWKKIFHPKNN